MLLDSKCVKQFIVVMFVVFLTYGYTDDCIDVDLNLDQYIANHLFTGIGVTVGGVQFAGTIGSWLLPQQI